MSNNPGIDCLPLSLLLLLLAAGCFAFFFGRAASRPVHFAWHINTWRGFWVSWVCRWLFWNPTSALWIMKANQPYIPHTHPATPFCRLFTSAHRCVRSRSSIQSASKHTNYHRVRKCDAFTSWILAHNCKTTTSSSHRDGCSGRERKKSNNNRSRNARTAKELMMVMMTEREERKKTHRRTRDGRSKKNTRRTSICNNKNKLYVNCNKIIRNYS